jgi:hypothetical protein
VLTPPPNPNPPPPPHPHPTLHCVFSTALWRFLLFLCIHLSLFFSRPTSVDVCSLPNARLDQRMNHQTIRASLTCLSCFFDNRRPHAGYCTQMSFNTSRRLTDSDATRHRWGMTASSPHTPISSASFSFAGERRSRGLVHLFVSLHFMFIIVITIVFFWSC